MASEAEIGGERWNCPRCWEGNPPWSRACCECDFRPHASFFLSLASVNDDEQVLAAVAARFLPVLDWLKAEIEVRSGVGVPGEQVGAREAFRQVLDRLTGDVSLIDELELFIDEAIRQSTDRIQDQRIEDRTAPLSELEGGEEILTPARKIDNSEALRRATEAERERQEARAAERLRQRHEFSESGGA